MLWERERERRFQLELLTVQLEHDGNVAVLGAGISIGISFVVFALTLRATASVTGVEITPLYDLLSLCYLFVGTALALICILVFNLVRRSRERELDRIRRKYVDW